MANFTRTAITDSFLKLLNQKRFDKITVKDIVSDCGVSRKTFYYYFEDIYDLLEKWLADLTQLSVHTIDNVQSFETELLRLMDFVFQNKNAVYHIYNSVSRERLENYLYESSLPVIQAIIQKELSGSAYQAQDIEIFATVCANAFTGSVLHWVRDGMPDTFEPMLKRIVVVFDDFLTSAKEKIN